MEYYKVDLNWDVYEKKISVKLIKRSFLERGHI